MNRYRASLFPSTSAICAAVVLSLLCSSCSSLKFWCWGCGDNEPARLHHIVLVWLKLPGNPTHRSHLIKVSESFAAIPGVKSVAVGEPLLSDREIVDDSFDIAIDLTFEDKHALQSYLNHPDHLRAVEVSLKPLADRIVVYDFVTPFPSYQR